MCVGGGDNKQCSEPVGAEADLSLHFDVKSYIKLCLLNLYICF